MRDAFRSPVNNLQNPSSSKMSASLRLILLFELCAMCSTQETCDSGYQFTLVPPVYGFLCNPYSLAEMKTLCAISSISSELQIDWYFQPSGLDDIVKITTNDKYIVTEKWEESVLTVELLVMQLNSSIDPGKYTCIASVNGILLSPNRTITLHNKGWYTNLFTCPSNAAREPYNQCLRAQPQTVSTSPYILIPSSTMPTPSSSDLVTHLSASPLQTLITMATATPLQSPITMATTIPLQSPITNIIGAPSTISQSWSVKHPLSFPSSTLQPNSLQISQLKIGLTEWLYISIALLLVALVIIISTLLSVVILLIRRNSVRNMVTAGAMVESRPVTRKPSDPLPPISEHKSKFDTTVASSPPGGAVPGTESGVATAWISPTKVNTPAARSGDSHQLSTLGNVAISFRPQSSSCASIYAEVGPPLSSAIFAASQPAPSSSSARGPGLKDPRIDIGVGHSLLQSHHLADHPYDTPEAVVHATFNRCVLPEETRVPSASGWNAHSGCMAREPWSSYRTGAPADTIRSVSTGDSWFGRWSPIFITQQQQQLNRTAEGSIGDDILSLTVRPSSQKSYPGFISPECAQADDHELGRDKPSSLTKQRLDSCSTFQSVGGVMESPGVVRYLQPSATAVSSELSLTMFDDDDSPLPVSCESRPFSSSTSNLCSEPIAEHIIEARNKSATAPTPSSRPPSSSSGYTDMSKYSGDYERDPVYMAVQRMRASRARDQKEDNKRDTGVFSEAEGLYSPLSWTGNGDVPNSVSALGYQSLNSNTISPPPTYTKPFHVSSKETSV